MSHTLAILIGVIVGISVGYFAERLPIAPILQSIAAGIVAMDRLQWQQLAERWLVDAKALLDAHRWSAAYYLAGYAVECGLKACVLARVASLS